MPRSKTVWSDSTPVSVQLGDAAHQGTYRTGDGMIEVSYGFLSKKAHLGGSRSAPAGLAKLILWELVAEEAVLSRRTAPVR